MTDHRETEAELTGVPAPEGKPKADPHTIGGRKLKPSTMMMGHGFDPMLSEGSLKPPVFLTSTFVFENAQQGKDFFDLTAGRRQLKPGEKSGLVEAVHLLDGIEGVHISRFNDKDVVRHALVGRIVRAYDQASAQKSAN